MYKTFRKSIALLLTMLMIFNVSAIAAGTTDGVGVKLYWSDDISPFVWNDVENTDINAIFAVDGFEAGSEAVRYLKVQSTGSLAYSYVLDAVYGGADASLAEAIDVYVKEGVTANVAISDMTRMGTLADVFAGAKLSEGKISPASEAATDGYYYTENIIAVALKMPETVGAEYMNKILDSFDITLSATECDFEYARGEFSVKFPNTDKYLYRVGNQNTVAVGSLFEGANVVGDVNVTVNTIDATAGATGTYTANSSDWTKGTIQFAGTGSVEVTITDSSEYTQPVSVKLEVINAKNATTATSATANNVVLLNDVTFSTLTVSNGYTLYGNGFKLHAPNDISYYDWAYSFVTLEDGNLDNVRVICPNFSYQVLYSSNMDDNGNTPGTTEDHYMNCRSAVKMSGACTISNSYISGGRVAVFAASGNPVIENTTLYGGAAANIQVLTVNNLLLKDATLVQEPIKANVNDTTKTVMGLSVVVMCDTNGNGSLITLEGDFVQYAWARESYKEYIPNGGQHLVSAVMSNDDYLHQFTYEDGVTADSVNLGFLYMPEDGSTKSSTNVTDNRTAKNSIPYDTANVSLAEIYSYKNSNGVDESYATKPSYESSVHDNIEANIVYKGLATDGVTVEKYYDSINGWMSKLTADLDVCGNFVLDFSDIVAEKCGRSLSYTVKDSSGNIVDKSIPTTISDSGMFSYVLEITDDVYYDADGQIVSDKSEVYTYNIEVVATKTSIEPPKFLADGTLEQPLLVVKAKDGDWSGAFPASLSAINVNYYSTDAKAYKDITLGDVVTLSKTGKQNGTNNYWEYSGSDFKLKITSGVIHEGKNAYGMPVVVNYGGKNRLFFTINTTNGYVSTNTSARSNILTYEFTDNNGQTITKTYSYTLNRSDLISGNGYTDTKQYSYDSFVAGSLSEASGSSSGCLTEGTLITLADGSLKKIEDLTFEDELLVWDFFEGKYTSANPTLLLDDGTKEYDVINLRFDDESEIDIIDIHGFYDCEANEYVYIEPENVASYVGKKFAKPVMDENGNKSNAFVTLVDYEVSRKTLGCYTVLTAYHNNCIANGMLTVTPPPIDGWYDYFEIGEDMKYVSVEGDIEEYGLYSYDDFKDYISYEVYEVFNGAYLKLPVEKGYFTFEELLAVVDAFGVGYFSYGADDDIAAGGDYNNGTISYGYDESDDYGIAPLADEEAPTITITSSGNTVSSATYGIAVSINGNAIENNSYVCDSDECVFTVSATGNAASRYAVISIGDNVYYTNALAPDAAASFTIKNAKGKTVSFAPVYGTHQNEVTTEIEFFAIKVSAQNAIETDGAYLCDTDESIFTFTASGVGDTGYGIVTIEGKDFYTSHIAPGETATIVVKNASGKTVTVATANGTHENDTTTEINYYSVQATTENMTATENGYACDTDEATITFAASGIADGYVAITVDGDVYYAIAKANSEAEVTVKNAKGKELTYEVFAGECENESTTLIDLGTVGYTVDGTLVTISNTTKYEAEGYDVYVAVYSGNKLLGVQFDSVEKLAAKDSKTFAPEIDTPDNSTVKVFIWKYKTLIPYFN